MKRGGRLVSWAAVVLAVPATVTFSPVNSTDSVRWEPQVVAADHTVHAGNTDPGVPTAPGIHTVRAVRAVQPTRAGLTAVRAALTRLGDPYVWAAAGPHAFDCSGLVVWSFEQAGVSLPHSSQALADGGQPVNLHQIQPGDVITYYSDASHVGLYVGGGKMVHASTYGVPVAVVPLDNAPIHNVRRYS